MRVRRPLVSLTLSLLGLWVSQAPAQAQAPEPVDDKAVEILRKHGLEKSQVMDLLSWRCDVHGPRLTGSPNLRRAQKWALSKFQEWKLKDPHLEEWGPFGLGWRLDHFSIEVLGENPWPVHAFPKAWSPSLPKRVEAEVVAVGELSADELKAIDLSDKIVLVQSTRAVSEHFDGEARRLDAEDLLARADGTRTQRRRGQRGGRRRGRRIREGNFRRGFQRRMQVMQIVYQQQPLAILDRGSKGDYGTIFVQSASVPAPPGTPRNQRPRPWKPGDQKVVPQFTLAVEHYNRICRLLKKKVPVRLGLELRTRFFDDNPMQHNVIGEIPGTDPNIADQVVMMGAHFDSWHSGTGATDNGCGSAVMMEAMRLLTELTRELGKGPRRTIRVGLWSGEEQGLLGSRAYVRQHFAEPASRDQPAKLKPEHQKLSGYFNLDNGTGKIRGVYLQGNEAIAPIFRAWLRPFHDLQASTLTLGNTGGTDHLAFDRVGLPGFQFIQDPVAYSPRTHHSNMDNWDHAVADDLKQAATIIASFAWHAAQRDGMLPRKPAAAEASSRRR